MHVFSKLLRLVAPLVAGLLALAAPLVRADVRTDSNGVWLARHYVVKPDYLPLVPEMAARFKDLRVRYLFVNTAFFNSKGDTDVVSKQLVPFLDALGEWEQANNHRFTVLLWLNGSLNPQNKRHIDLSLPALRETLVAECVRYMNPAAPRSYLAGARRVSDGVILDVEPAGANPALFEHINEFMRAIKEAAGPGQKVGFAAHKIGDQNPYQFADIYYHRLARNLDYIVGMNYNSGRRTPEDYQAWMETQTRNTLRAVSGAAWNNDAEHPAPANGVKVFMGAGVFPTDGINHRAGVENVREAARGIKAGLVGLDAASLSYLEGLALYSHHDGVTESGYARWDHEWEEFRAHWLTP